MNLEIFTFIQTSVFIKEKGIGGLSGVVDWVSEKSMVSALSLGGVPEKNGGKNI